MARNNEVLIYRDVNKDQLICRLCAVFRFPGGCDYLHKGLYVDDYQLNHHRTDCAYHSRLGEEGIINYDNSIHEPLVCIHGKCGLASGGCTHHNCTDELQNCQYLKPIDEMKQNWPSQLMKFTDEFVDDVRDNYNKQRGDYA